MKLTTHDGIGRPGMAGHGNVRLLIMADHIIEQLFQTCILLFVRFALIRLPERITLREAGLEGELGKLVLDERLAAALVACMLADLLAEQL